MDLLAALKGIFSGKFKGVIKTHKEANTDSHDVKQEASFVNNGNITILNFKADDNGLLPPAQIEELRKVLIPKFDEGEVMFLQEESQSLIGSYKQFKTSAEIQPVLEYFKDKISRADLTLLESGLYEKHLLETGQIEKAKTLKANIVANSPTRSKNIVNLASGGFFTSHIQPLYEALASQPQFEKVQFDKEYEQIVNELPFAIFVHSGINDDDVTALLLEKAERNIRYAVQEETIILNGFGNNAERVEAMIPMLKKTYKRVAPNVYYMGDLKCIQVSVYYREIN
ncbi:MAG: hypothetical protein WAO28_01630 [Candidatus Microsaccharimonas sp.]